MDVFYQLQGVTFEWDAEKAKINIGKHGVTFQEACETFFDPFYKSGNSLFEDEQREFIIVFTFDFRLLLTIFIERSDKVRIISARLATKEEQKIYAE